MAENEQFNPKEIAAWRKEVKAAKEDVKEIFGEVWETGIYPLLNAIFSIDI